MRNSYRKNSAPKRGVLIALCIVLSLILVALLALTFVLLKWDDYKDRINRVDRVDITKDPLYQQMLQDGQLIETSEDVINILLIGQDAREGEGRQRADAMILCTVNLKTKTLTMTSFMRDMYVEIPGYSSNRINACYQIGGMELLNKCILKNFGVVVDANIEVNFSGFMQAVDMVGGVDIELTESEAAHMNDKGNWGVGESTAGQWNLKAGMNHLTGEQALAYSRIRYVGNADFGRTERQRKVLTALLEDCKDLSVGELDRLIKQILPLMTTDMDDKQIDEYVLKILPALTKLEVQQLRVPADGAYYDDTVSGMSVLIPDIEKNKALLEEAMRK